MIKRQMKGRKFGSLLVLRHSDTHTKTSARYLCLCDCGNKVDVSGTHLWAGRKTTCGCDKPPKRTKQSTRQASTPPEWYKKVTKHPLYVIWSSMKCRCHGVYVNKDYQGRGIAMHPEWKNDFWSFCRYVEGTIGSRPDSTHSIDRIDNDAGYVPGNIRWATDSEQRKNQRVSSASLVVDGKPISFYAFCKQYGLSMGKVSYRMAGGVGRKQAILEVAEQDGVELPEFAEYA